LILIFGASGFLGSTIANYISAGEQVIAVTRPDSLNSRLRETPHIKIVQVAENLWPNLVEHYKANIIICAQWDGVAKSKRNNQSTQLKNLRQITDLALIAKANNCRKFIALGSQAEAEQSQTPIREEYIDSGTDWYGKTKSLLCSNLMEIFEGSQTSFIWARVFSIYGPGEERESLIPELLRAKALGNSFTIKEPSKLWSLLYSSDFAAAIQVLVKDNFTTPIVNVAHPELITIKQICENLPNIHVVYTRSDSLSDIGYFPVVSKLKALGWHPRVSIAEGCKITKEFFE